MILLKNQTHNFWYNTRVFFEWKSIMERILKEKYFRALQSFFYITPFVNVISESISISLEYQYHHIIARNDFILFYFIYFYFSKAARHGLFDFFFFSHLPLPPFFLLFELTSVFFQGPIGLDGPKGEPVSARTNLPIF